MWVALLTRLISFHMYIIGGHKTRVLVARVCADMFALRSNLLWGWICDCSTQGVLAWPAGGA